jgi:hypothetical protein
MIRRLFKVTVLAVALAGALVVAPSQTKPAEARIGWTDVPDVVSSAVGNMNQGRLWDISILRACRQQYPGLVTVPHTWSPSNPYSWVCLRVLSWVPYRVQYLGGLDLARYCRENHPGTYLYLGPGLGAWGWGCVRGSLA